jgi:hypothetical protein
MSAECEVCGEVHERCMGHKLTYEGEPLRPCKKWPVRGGELCYTHGVVEMREKPGPEAWKRAGKSYPSAARLDRGERLSTRGSGPAVDENGLCSRCGEIHLSCTGHRKDGRPCGMLPLVGLSVCRRHGGSQPRAKAKSERIRRNRELAKYVEGQGKALIERMEKSGFLDE